MSVVEKRGTEPRCGALLSTPIPEAPFLAIHSRDARPCAIRFISAPCTVAPVSDTTAKAIAALLRRYFVNGQFVSPRLQPCRGTPFQRRVWRALQQIPAGETRRYAELAMQLNSSPRAVAQACRANPLPILIPCHRVVAASGIGGYMGQSAGPMLAIKHWLLQHEGHV